MPITIKFYLAIFKQLPDITPKVSPSFLAQQFIDWYRSQHSLTSVEKKLNRHYWTNYFFSAAITFILLKFKWIIKKPSLLKFQLVSEQQKLGKNTSFKKQFVIN